MPKLDAIEWEKLAHAYGTAEDVPKWLDQLRTATTDDVAEEAMEYLFGVLWHQYTVYGATAAATPFLVEALNYCRPIIRSDLLRLLDLIADGMSYLDQHEGLLLAFESEAVNSEEYQVQKQRELCWVADCVRSVWTGLDCYVDLLDDPSLQMRINVSHLLATLLSKDKACRPTHLEDVDRKVSNLLKDSLSADSESLVQCSYVFALTSIPARKQDNVLFLEQLMKDMTDPRLKISIALATRLLEQMDGAVEVLIDALTRSAETDRLYKSDLEWPWFDRWLRFQLVGCLCALPQERLGQLMPALLATIDRASDMTANEDLAPILRYAFQGQKVNPEMGIQQLSKPQNLLLQRIYDNEKLLTGKSGNAELVFSKIGLSARRDGWKDLLGFEQT